MENVVKNQTVRLFPINEISENNQEIPMKIKIKGPSRIVTLGLLTVITDNYPGPLQLCIYYKFKGEFIPIRVYRIDPIYSEFNFKVRKI